jgi:Family of unknown function (DUF6623)
MPVTQMWMHGNALLVEPPNFRAESSGPSAQVALPNFGGAWMHIPVPTPAVLDGVRSRLLRVFFLFEISGSTAVGALQVFDGSTLVQEFTGLQRFGSHSASADADNTFNLTNPHTVNFGISVTVRLRAATSPSAPAGTPSRLAVPAVGGDFET